MPVLLYGQCGVVKAKQPNNPSGVVVEIYAEIKSLFQGPKGSSKNNFKLESLYIDK